MKKNIENKDKLIFIYNNDMNYIQFKDFNSMELNLFFTLCALMKEKGLQTVTLSFSEIRNLIQYKKTGTLALIKLLESTYDKMINLKFRIGDEINFEKFVLFTGYTVKGAEKKVEITVNSRFEYILNNFKDVLYTSGNLKTFNSFASKYSKLLFKELLSQRKTGKKFFRIEEFRRVLDIPENHRMSDIDKRVLRAIDKELPEFFEDFKYKKEYKGKEVTNINFFFSLKNKENNKEIKEAEIVEGENIEKFWKQNFIDVNYTSKHKAVIEKMKLKNSESTIKKYLLEQWNYVEKNKRVKKKAAYFSSLILKEKAVLKDYVKANKVDDEADKNQADKFMGNLFSNLENIKPSHEQEKEEKIESLMEISQEEYDLMFEKYMKENGYTDKDVQKIIFRIINKYKYKIV